VTLSYEGHVRDEIARGRLVRVLEKFCEPFPGYYLYYPQRRQASRALRALIEHLRRARQPSPRQPAKRRAAKLAVPSRL
jgi:DNA-binding transcriptional LysR family regulator